MAYVVHGHTIGGQQSKTYRTWRRLFNRCYNPRSHNFHDYGERGIKVCERWGTFANFLADMGEKPAGMSLDRINNNGDYEPSNCRWTTNRQQCRNKRNNVRIKVDGKEVPIAELADRLGLKRDTLYARLRRGWSPEDATQPVLDAQEIIRRARKARHR